MDDDTLRQKLNDIHLDDIPDELIAFIQEICKVARRNSYKYGYSDGYDDGYISGGSDG
jgi:hypothetical protein